MVNIIETERLYLREMTQEDFPALYTVLADSDIMRHYPYSFDENRVCGWIETNIERYRVYGFGLWAVVLKETGEMIGDCGLTMQNINGRISPEIGYHIAKSHQRQGYAKEAARLPGLDVCKHSVQPAFFLHENGECGVFGDRRSKRNDPCGHFY